MQGDSFLLAVYLHRYEALKHLKVGSFGLLVR